MSRRLLLIIIILLLALISSACDEESISGYSMGTFYEIDPLFREFYDHLGGAETLGPAISPLFPHNEVKYQYTRTSLMVYDPLAPANARFHLAALGLDMGIAEPAVLPPVEAGHYYVDGHIIFSDFVPFYEQLGGVRYVGRPITEVHYNPETRRYEQHFENLGIYRLDGEPPNSAHLLDYGAWKCDASCRQLPVSNSMVILHPAVGQPFAEAISRLGSSFTGFALTDPYTAPDGILEQVFENIVLAIDPGNPGWAFLRPLSERLGILPDPLVAASPDPILYFYPIQGDLGYNVSKRFLDYMAQHGGMEISGSPVTELTRINDYVYRQCFKNLCLEEHRNVTGTVWVRPAPLGYSFRQVSLRGFTQTAQPTKQPDLPMPTLEAAVQPVIQPTPQPETPIEAPPIQPQVQPTVASIASNPTLRELSIQVWEINPMVAPDQGQEIGVSITENSLPVAGIEPDLIVSYPGRGDQIFYMFPTGSDGQTRMQVDPAHAPNGTLIPYQVCVYNSSGEKFCVKDSFLIWQNP